MTNLPDGRHVEGAAQADALLNLLKAVAGREKSQVQPMSAIHQLLMQSLPQEAGKPAQAHRGGFPPGLMPQHNQAASRLPGAVQSSHWNGIDPAKAAAGLQGFQLQQFLRNLPQPPNHHGIGPRPVQPAQPPVGTSVGTSNWNVKPEPAVQPTSKDFELQLLAKFMEMQRAGQVSQNEHMHRLLSQALVAGPKQPQPTLPQPSGHAPQLPQMLEALAPILLANQHQQLQQRAPPVLPPRPLADAAALNRVNVMEMLATLSQLQQAPPNGAPAKPTLTSQSTPVISGPLAFSRADAANGPAAHLGKRQRDENDAVPQQGKPLSRVPSEARAVGQEPSTSVRAASSALGNRAPSPAPSHTVSANPPKVPIIKGVPEWEHTSSQGSGRYHDDANNKKALKMMQQAGSATGQAAQNKDTVAIAPAVATSVPRENVDAKPDAQEDADKDADAAACNDALRLAAEALVCLGAMKSPPSNGSGGSGADRNRRMKGRMDSMDKKQPWKKRPAGRGSSWNKGNSQNSRDYTTVWSSVLGCYVARSKRSFQPMNGTAGSERGDEHVNGVDVEHGGGSNGSAEGYAQPKDHSFGNRNSVNSHPSANSEC